MSNEIDEIGFNVNSTPDAGETIAKDSKVKAKKSFNKWLALPVVIVAAVGIGAYMYTPQTASYTVSLDDLAAEDQAQMPGVEQSPLNTFNENGIVASSNDFKDTKDDGDSSDDGEVGFSVENGPDGVSINGVHNLLVTALLSNYPTHSEMDDKIKQVNGASVSQEELDVFLLAVTENSKKLANVMKELRKQSDISKAAKELQKVNAELRKQGARGDELAKTVGKLNDRVGTLVKKVDKIEKNSGWYHNRISKLEGKPVPSKRKKVAKAQIKPASKPLKVRRLELNNASDWMVKGAAERVAFITNKKSGRPIRVTMGYDIPGCGLVTGINPLKQRITTTSCVIEN